MRMPATRAAVLAVIFTAACSGTPPAPATAVSTNGAALSSAIGAIVCGARPACRIVERRDAGSTPAGDALTVVKAWVGAPAYQPGVHEDGGCPEFEWWSMVVHGGAVRSHQFLVAGGNQCLQWNNGETASVGPNSFTYVFAGSGAPIVREGLPQVTVIQLSPVAVRSGPGDATVQAWDTPIVSYVEW